jgi:putative nucleotidyltransferase with HDIG domain
MRWWPTFGRKARATRRKPTKGGAGRDRARRREVGEKRRRFQLSWPVLLVFLLLGTVASISVIYRRTPTALHYVVGQVADRYVYSVVRFQYVDDAQTAKRREQAAQRVPPVYRRNPLVVASAVQMLNELKKELDEFSPPIVEGEEESVRTSRAQELVGQLTPEERKLLADVLDRAKALPFLQELVETALYSGLANAEDIRELTEDGGGLAKIQVMSDESGTVRSSLVPVADLHTPEQMAPTVCDQFLARYPAPDGRVRALLEKVVHTVLQPNLTYHTEATQQAREKAAEGVQDVVRVVPANEVLLKPGKIVTKEDLEKLATHQQALYDRERTRHAFLDRFVTMLLCLVISGGATACLMTSQPQVVADRGMLGALTLGLALQMVLTRLTVNLYFLWLGSSPFVFGALPLAFAAMLLTPLVGAPAAVWAGVIGAVVAGLQNSPAAAFRIFLVGTAASLVGTYMMQGVRKRSQIYRAGLAVGAVTFVFEVLLAFRAEFSDTAISRVLLLLLLHAMANGLALSIAVSVLLPLFEFIFGLVTDITLLELTDLNHPVLRRLQLEAPGTYHHSITVATLVEQAAEAIGANPLLARVCAYFHDIGKLAQPVYFTENSRDDNPHDDLSPRMSSLVILNHVKEGMDLAREYKLKRPLREAIEQHHGTTMVSYFYHKAKSPGDGNGNGDANVHEGDYRYPGPRPVRKEIAILSIADCCEAASRSLARPTPQRVENLIDQLVVARVRDHQLDNAELTFAELTKVRQCMVRTLTAMLHTRISYPGDKKEDDEAAPYKTMPPSAPPQAERSAEDAAPGSDA